MNEKNGSQRMSLDAFEKKCARELSKVLNDMPDSALRQLAKMEVSLECDIRRKGWGLLFSSLQDAGFFGILSARPLGTLGTAMMFEDTDDELWPEVEEDELTDELQTLADRMGSGDPGDSSKLPSGLVASCIRAVVTPGLIYPLNRGLTTLGGRNHQTSHDDLTDIAFLVEHVSKWWRNVLVEIPSVFTYPLSREGVLSTWVAVAEFSGERAVNFERNPCDAVLLLWQRELALMGRDCQDEVTWESLSWAVKDNFHLMFILSCVPETMQINHWRETGTGRDAQTANFWTSGRFRVLIAAIKTAQETATALYDAFGEGTTPEEPHRPPCDVLDELIASRRTLHREIKNLLLKCRGIIDTPSNDSEAYVARVLVCETGLCHMTNSMNGIPEHRHVNDDIYAPPQLFSDQAIAESEWRSYANLKVLVAVLDILTSDRRRRRRE